MYEDFTRGPSQRRKFGRARVDNCECTSNFTCRACLDAPHPDLPPSRAKREWDARLAANPSLTGQDF